MEILCTRPSCPRPENRFDDLDHATTLKTVQQRYCKSCGMPLILGGRYLTLKLLGKGGFGAAFLACDRHTTKLRQCVVKQFQPSGNLDPKSLEVAQGLFEREASVLEEIGNEHSQIPDLFAFFPLVVPNLQQTSEEQYFYIVQEFIDGQNLEEELEKRGKFSEAEVRTVLNQILPILNYIHNLNIIHRDIKPSNIMRDKNNKLYLLDFGAVKQVTSVASPSTRSTSVYSMGFAPPEQMRGSQVYPSTDLYALATTCLYLLSGKSSEELFDDHRNQWNWRPYIPNLSDNLGQILDKLLANAPQDRFQSAEEVLTALNPSLSSQPKTAIQPTSPTPPPPQVSKPPKPAKIARPPRFSAFEVLFCAGFTGFEGTIIMIALHSFFSQGAITTLIPNALYIGLGIIAVLVLMQWAKWIERVDLLVFAAISTGIIYFFSFLQGSLGFDSILIYAGLGGVAAIAVATLFQLIYRFLKRLFS